MVPALWCCAIGEHYGRDFCFAVLVRAQCSSAQDASGEALAEVACTTGDDDSHAAMCAALLGSRVLQTVRSFGSQCIAIDSSAYAAIGAIF